MIWKTKTHEFAATVCQRTGAPCPALAQMARALTQAMSATKPVTKTEFEIEGTIDLSHCPEGCTARFRAQCDQIRVFCGADPETAIDRLDDYADMMFGTEFSSLPSDLLRNHPCAMLEASLLAPHTGGEISPHVAA